MMIVVRFHQRGKSLTVFTCPMETPEANRACVTAAFEHFYKV
jgi:hypothetical protein